MVSRICFILFLFVGCDFFESKEEKALIEFIEINHMIDVYDHFLDGAISQKQLGVNNKQLLCIIQGVLRPRFEELAPIVKKYIESLEQSDMGELARECQSNCSCTILNNIRPLGGFPPPQDIDQTCLNKAKSSWLNASKEIKDQIQEYCSKS